VDLFADDRDLTRICAEMLAYEDPELRLGVRFRFDRSLKEALEDLSELGELLVHGHTLAARRCGVRGAPTIEVAARRDSPSPRKKSTPSRGIAFGAAMARDDDAAGKAK
jgi:hypothetical protein